MTRTEPAAPVIELAGVDKSFDGKAVLGGLDLRVANGEFLTLLGPSGCGKTTVLRLIAGFEQPDAGSVRIAGQDVSRLPPEQRRVNTVFQSYALFPHLTVADNIAFGLRMKKLPPAEVQARVQEALAMVRLEGLGSRRPHELSGGQQQRVALARAVVNKPLVLLLDESLSALDYKLRKQMQLELKSLQRRLGISFVFVTHDQEEALAMSDRVVLLDRGRIAQSGPPREIYERPASLFVARFVGEANILTGTVRACHPAPPPAGACGINPGSHTAQVALLGCEFGMRVNQPFAPGDRVHVVVRPEDMRIWSDNEQVPDGQPFMRGRIAERTYKGSTLDSQVVLDDGTVVTASEFFDEDAPDFDHPLGEAVRVGWVPNWETVLPYEGDDA